MNENNKTQTVAEILRNATARQPVRMPLANVEIIPEENVRLADVSTWDIPALADAFALEGQIDPVVLRKVGKDKYRPLRGFRRCSAAKYNAERGIVDPATGKVFDSVSAFVINEELSQKEQFALILDGGNTRLLNRVEILNAVEKADKVWDTAAQIAIALRGLLDLYFQAPAEVKTDEEYADHRRGAIQNLLNAVRSPLPLYEACLAKAAGKQKWPNEREVMKLYSAFQKEMKADKTNKISRLKPGKEWMKLWKEFLDKKTSDAAAGKKPKSTAMMTGENVDTAKSACNSRTIKTLFDIVKRTKPQESLAKLDAALVDIEAGKCTVEQFTAILDEINPATPDDADADSADAE